MLVRVIGEMEKNHSLPEFKPVWDSYFEYFTASWGRMHPKQWLTMGRASQGIGQEVIDVEEFLEEKAMEDSMDSDCSAWDSDSDDDDF